MNSSLISDTSVLSHESVGAGYRQLCLHAPEIVAAARPGQFVHVRVPALDPSALRRPFSICDANADTGVLTILYKVVGRGTRAMESLAAGDRVSVMGPLGNGFPEPPRGTTPLLVGGGYGTAPLYFFARLHQNDARKPVLFVGARTAADVLLVEKFEALGLEVHVATNDGSRGETGLVTNPLDAWLDANGGASSPMIFACGPAPMLRALDERALARDIPAALSLDRRMACGIGACLGCTQMVRNADGTQTLSRVCKDGPVYSAGQIVW